MKQCLLAARIALEGERADAQDKFDAAIRNGQSVAFASGRLSGIAYCGGLLNYLEQRYVELSAV